MCISTCYCVCSASALVIVSCAMCTFLSLRCLPTTERRPRLQRAPHVFWDVFYDSVLFSGGCVGCTSGVLQFISCERCPGSTARVCSCNNKRITAQPVYMCKTHTQAPRRLHLSTNTGCMFVTKRWWLCGSFHGTTQLNGALSAQWCSSVTSGQTFTDLTMTTE